MDRADREAVLLGERAHLDGVLAGGVLRDHDLDAGVAGLGHQIGTSRASGRAKNAAEENRTGEGHAPHRRRSRELRRGPRAPRMLRAMWVFPLVAAVVAFVFAGLLVRQFAARRRSYQLLWAIALVMYGVASLAVVVGALNGWSRLGFEVYWALGAVLNVPFLAAGEIAAAGPQPHGRRGRSTSCWCSSTAYTIVGARAAPRSTPRRSPSGSRRASTCSATARAAHRLPQLISIPSYLILRGRHAAGRPGGCAAGPSCATASIGTLLIALGATIDRRVRLRRSPRSATCPGSRITLLVGIAVMFWGFLRASAPGVAGGRRPADWAPACIATARG